MEKQMEKLQEKILEKIAEPSAEHIGNWMKGSSIVTSILSLFLVYFMTFCFKNLWKLFKNLRKLDNGRVDSDSGEPRANGEREGIRRWMITTSIIIPLVLVACLVGYSYLMQGGLDSLTSESDMTGGNGTSASESGSPTSGSGTSTGESGNSTGGNGTSASESGNPTSGSGISTGESGNSTGGSGTSASESGSLTSGSGTSTGESGNSTGGSGTSTGKSGSPTGGSGIPTTGHGSLTTDRECKRLNKNDYNDVTEDLLLGKIKYTVNSVTSELNLVEELADENRWELVAEVRKLVNPHTIRAHFRETREELLESSRKLFKKICEQGYKGEFDWDAYIKGFKNIQNIKLTRVIKDLEDMLKCLGINRTVMEAVNPKHFRYLECGGKTLNLEEAMAEEWRGIAREFGIKEHTIFSEGNIPKKCAEKVLKQLHQLGISWLEIIETFQEAGLKSLATRLERAIDNYCMKA